MSELKDRIYNILFTRKGEVPYKPHFGSDIFDHIDKPINVAIPSIKQAIIESINRNEQSVRVKKVVNKGLEFSIFFEGIGSELVLDLNSIKDTKVLRVNYSGLIASISLAYEGALVLSDSLSISDLIGWLRINWGAYGNWYMIDYSNTILLETKLQDISISINNA